MPIIKLMIFNKPLSALNDLTSINKNKVKSDISISNVLEFNSLYKFNFVPFKYVPMKNELVKSISQVRIIDYKLLESTDIEDIHKVEKMIVDYYSLLMEKLNSCSNSITIYNRVDNSNAVDRLNIRHMLSSYYDKLIETCKRIKGAKGDFVYTRYLALPYRKEFENYYSKSKNLSDENVYSIKKDFFNSILKTCINNLNEHERKHIRDMLDLDNARIIIIPIYPFSNNHLFIDDDIIFTEIHYFNLNREYKPLILNMVQTIESNSSSHNNFMKYKLGELEVQIEISERRDENKNEFIKLLDSNKLDIKKNFKTHS